MKKSIISIATLIVLSVNASEYKLECPRPLKPTEFTQQIEVDSYNSSVNNYKSCIDTFIRQHKQELNKHTQAVNDAVNEWNSFASGTKKKDAKRKFTGSQGAPEAGSRTVGKSDPYKISTGWKF